MEQSKVRSGNIKIMIGAVLQVKYRKMNPYVKAAFTRTREIEERISRGPMNHRYSALYE